MQNQRLTTLRLAKEENQLLVDPVPGAIVKRHGQNNFHFCIIGAEPQYAGGFYHGMLQLPENYPFSAPKLLFFTPSGRFQVNTPICTTFTNYHPQSWTSAWNVRTMMLATMSFMYSNESGYGCKQASDDERKNLARLSLKKNLENPLFKQLFAAELRLKGLNIPQDANINMQEDPEPLFSNLQQVQDRQQRLDGPNRANNRRRNFWIVRISIVVGVGILIIYVKFSS